MRMKKPRQNQDQNYVGAAPEQPLPIGSQPEIQNVQPLIPQPQKKQISKHRIKLRK